jgi:signal transduction histidine kinase
MSGGARRPPVPWPVPWRSGLVALAALALALALAAGALQAPAEDVRLLAVYLAASGLASLTAAWVVARLGWRLPWGGLHLRVALAIALGTLVALANVAVTAALMFLSPHDLALLGLLLGFALVLSLAFGAALAGSLTADLRRLAGAARRMAAGDLAARVAVAGDDEVGELALAFNTMAASVQAAFGRQRRAEQARRDLIAAVSHDLRTPLTALRAMAEALEDGVVADPATTGRYLRTMQAEIGRLDALIADLFELSRLDAGELRLDRRAVVIADLIEATVLGQRALAERQGVRLDHETDGSSTVLKVDPARVQRVLANLIQNALQHTPPGGRVTVRARRDGATVEVAVADTGVGIAAHALPHVFERFYRADPARGREHGGAGLGLAIARGLVEAHGGRIWAESEVDRGTTVRFTLPPPTDQPVGSRQ